MVERYPDHLTPRDPRAGLVLHQAFGRIGAQAHHPLPNPIVYQDEQDYSRILDAYTNRRHVEAGMGMIFLAPDGVKNDPEKLNQRWARMLTEVNADFHMAVLVPEPDVARLVAARLRNTGGLGVRHLFLQRIPRGVRVPLAPVTDPTMLARIQSIQAAYG